MTDRIENAAAYAEVLARVAEQEAEIRKLREANGVMKEALEAVIEKTLAEIIRVGALRPNVFYVTVLDNNVIESLTRAAQIMGEK